MWRQMEFQAVVLAAGKGSRMTELTASRAKCLLPIGNYPMLYYPLKLLARNGFMEVIVVVQEEWKNEIALAIDKLNIRLRCDFVGIPGGDDLGTADVLRLIHEKFYTDIIVLPCDLIMNIDLSGIFNSYRRHSAIIISMLIQLPTFSDKLINPGPKSKPKPERDLIGIDNETNRLIFFASASDFEEKINISRKLYKKHTNFNINSNLLDIHLYIIHKWILDCLLIDKSISSIKGELLPYVIKKQSAQTHNPNKIEKSTFIMKQNTDRDIFKLVTEKALSKRKKRLDVLISEMSPFNDHSTNLENAYNEDLIKCYAFIQNTKFGFRANNIHMYALANTVIHEKWAILSAAPTIFFDDSMIKTNQVENCTIGYNASISEKTSLKLSHIGTSAVIETKTRVLNSVVMENVTVKEGCVINNCILCNDSVVEEGCELNHCIVGANHTVPAGSRHSDEVLTDIGNLMEI
ncbi:translation initiation factor eIF2B subunit gamma [Neodiprion pinetum]|uniref:translation initiation factor eIF2B subunit gamma n=1 Tax=Neodiprion pinetum TaxID=441929 RepID=UPI001EDE970E|nr:translation initiation factor eIF-2B subunit gamma [Neodiprion pinetum]XP_046479539.1 translation initiation factor eIF-2B subunit gamma [Neodiprion pinetum]XP_046479540.1 translation initiation factor eIF-2B subunit gamma [Neodiprion pinetum]XP_046479541.1 translation initiation factor eIF-2B subunit gamma [Neodiprion pinetum]